MTQPETPLPRTANSLKWQRYRQPLCQATKDPHATHFPSHPLPGPGRPLGQRGFRRRTRRAHHRAQVRALLHQAQRTGDLLAPGECGLQLIPLFPGQYPHDNHAVRKTRAQVREELQAAKRTGNVLAWGESGLQLNALDHQRYNGVY